MRKTKVLVKILYSISSSIVLVLVLFGLSSFFKIRVIETNADPVLLKDLSKLADYYIFFLPEDKIKNHFLKNPVVKEVKITRKYPRTIFIELTYRDKTAMIFAKNSFFIVDETGFIFEKVSTNSGYPIVNLENQEVGLGTNITHNNLNKVLRIIKLARDRNMQFIDIRMLTNDDISMHLDQGVQVVIGKSLEAEEIVSSLQIMIKRFTIEGKIPKKIDFRFTKPVVTF